MELSRRNFLATAVAGFAAVAVANSVAAAVQDQHIENIKELVRMHDEIVAMQAKPGVRLPQFTQSDMNAKFDAFVDHVVTNFSPSAEITLEEDLTIRADLDRLFREETPLNVFRNIPPTHIPMVIGVAALRSLLKENKLVFIAKDCPNFDRLAKAYMPFIRKA